MCSGRRCEGVSETVIVAVGKVLRDGETVSGGGSRPNRARPCAHSRTCHIRSTRHRSPPNRHDPSLTPTHHRRPPAPTPSPSTKKDGYRKITPLPTAKHRRRKSQSHPSSLGHPDETRKVPTHTSPAQTCSHPNEQIRRVSLSNSTPELSESRMNSLQVCENLMVLASLVPRVSSGLTYGT